MQRKETFATSGVRIRVRLFGGWDMDRTCEPRDWVQVAYAQGVPMGGDLPAAKGKAPVIRRLGGQGSRGRQSRPHPDHQGLDKNGQTFEKIYRCGVVRRSQVDPVDRKSFRRWATRSTS